MRFFDDRGTGPLTDRAVPFTAEPERRWCESPLAIKAWETAIAMLSDPSIGVVVLDELNSALENGYVPLHEVIEAIGARPAHQHVVISGRGLPSVR